MMAIFRIGTTILATKTISANGHMPCSSKNRTPLRIVSDCVWPSDVKCMIGKRLAGT